MKERERGRGEGKREGGGETDAHIKHILLLWHRKRKTHDVCGSPCFLEPFKVTAARVASAPFSTSSGPYLDNGMLRAACHDVQKLRSTFSALLLESCVYRSKKKKKEKGKQPAQAMVSVAATVKHTACMNTEMRTLLNPVFQ